MHNLQTYRDITIQLNLLEVAMLKRFVSSLFLTTCLWTIANFSEYSTRFEQTHSNIKKHEAGGISSIILHTFNFRRMNQ